MVVGALNESKDHNYGFDAQSMKYVDMLKAGIIDPAKVVRTALQDAESVASLLLNTEVVITEKPQDKESSGGQRGGMGGMDF